MYVKSNVKSFVKSFLPVLHSILHSGDVCSAQLLNKISRNLKISQFPVVNIPVWFYNVFEIILFRAKEKTDERNNTRLL
jgi:hypothetical protein